MQTKYGHKANRNGKKVVKQDKTKKSNCLLFKYIHAMLMLRLVKRFFCSSENFMRITATSPFSRAGFTYIHTHAMRMDFIRYHYILVACSSTLVRRRFALSLISECCMYRIGRVTKTCATWSLTSRHHQHIHFISLHHSSIQSQLCNLSSRCVYVVFMYLNRLTLHIRQENVSAYSETRESCNEFSFFTIFPIYSIQSHHHLCTRCLRFALFRSISFPFSLSSFLFSTFLPLTLLGYVNLYASMLLISSWRTVFIISFGLFSTRLVVVQLVFSTKFYKWCDSHLYLGPFSGVKWMNATWHTVVSIFTLTLSIYFCRQKRQNMKLNRSKIRITTDNLPDTFCILINLSYWISEQTKAWKRTVIMKTRDP